MKATDLLRSQHELVRRLFQRIEVARNEGEKSMLFEELGTALVGHDMIEREIFYPACEAQMGGSDLLGQVVVEHGVIEFGLQQADLAVGESDFAYKLKVLSALVDQHVDVEESELFPKVERTFSSDRLEQMGAEMEERFAELVAQDFRRKLDRSLRRALGGLAGPVKRPPRPTAKRAVRRRTGAAKKTARARKATGTVRRAAKR